jgi:hypothetical protein
MKETLITKFDVDCDCMCGQLQFSQFKDDGIALISYNIPAFDAYQNGTWEIIKRRAKIIWNVLLGKDYRFYEVLIEDNKTLNDFKRWVSEMKEIDEN